MGDKKIASKPNELITKTKTTLGLHSRITRALQREGKFKSRVLSMK